MQEIEIDSTLRTARVAVGLTQSELAARVGVTRQTIGLIEVGKYNPSIKLCLMLARETGKSVNELFRIREAS